MNNISNDLRKLSIAIGEESENLRTAVDTLFDLSREGGYFLGLLGEVEDDDRPELEQLRDSKSALDFLKTEDEARRSCEALTATMEALSLLIEGMKP